MFDLTANETANLTANERRVIIYSRRLSRLHPDSAVVNVVGYWWKVRNDQNAAPVLDIVQWLKQELVVANM